MVDKVADKDNLLSKVENILNAAEELPPNKEYHMGLKWSCLFVKDKDHLQSKMNRR
jgi:hypothetical protein